MSVCEVTGPISRTGRFDMSTTHLHNAGLYLSHAKELFGEADFVLLLDQTERWLASPKVQDECRKFAEGKRDGGLKDFWIKYRDDRLYAKTDALLPIANAPEVRKIVEQAIGPAKLICMDVVHNPPGCNQRAKQWSQSWHRDPEAPELIKVFVYLSNVDIDSGPFEYVLGSHLAYWDLCPPGLYPPGDGLRLDKIPAQLFTKNIGERGTVIFANTAGLHQGGHGVKPRTMAVFTWVPEQSGHPVIYTIKG